MWKGEIAPDGAACGGRGASCGPGACSDRANASGGHIFAQEKGRA